MTKVSPYSDTVSAVAPVEGKNLRDNTNHIQLPVLRYLKSQNYRSLEACYGIESQLSLQRYRQRRSKELCIDIQNGMLCANLRTCP